MAAPKGLVYYTCMDATLQRLTTDVLTAHGYEVECARDAGELSHLVESRQPDLIIAHVSRETAQSEYVDIINDHAPKGIKVLVACQSFQPREMEAYVQSLGGIGVLRNARSEALVDVVDRAVQAESVTAAAQVQMDAREIVTLADTYKRCLAG